MIRREVALGMVVLAVGVAVASTRSMAQESASETARPKPATMRQLQQALDDLSDKYDRIAKEMSEMKADAQRREAELEAAEKRAQDAQAQIEALKQQQAQEQQAEQSAQAVMAQHNEAVATLQSAVADLRSTASSFADTLQTDQKRGDAPDAIPFMGIHLKPGGFLAAETVDRQRGTGGDINTQFSAIPFSGQTAGQLSEFNATARQSRVSFLAEGRLSSTALRGYFEGDFLSAGVTSNDNQSNSYTLRVRQAWAQAELNSGWIFTGGQMWSLATEYRSGLLNAREAIPQTIDPQYTVGFTWARQYGFRFVKRINDRFWAGTSVEEAQTLNLGGHNLPAIVYQQAGNSGGLYNSTANYSFNFVPDFVAKIVYEPPFGHFEIFSVGRFFRARAFPNASPILTTTTWGPSSPSTLGAFTAKTSGGGLGANARIFLFNRSLEVGAHGLAGDGIGRYSSSTLADATAHPGGTLELLVGGSALGSVEWHATPRLDLYAYYGGEYAKRAYYNTGYVVTTAPTSVYMPPLGQPILGGYGAPTNIVIGCQTEVVPAASANGGGDVPGSALGCTADNRNIQEGTAGYWFRFYKGPKGSLQQGIQYSYLVRHTWQGVGLAADPVTGTPAIPGSPDAIDNMFFTSFRYYLPQ
jgi:Skp family chaperone for outer membrane proteins